MSDARTGLYTDLHQRHAAVGDRRRSSAEIMLGLLWDYIQPASALDVGCGVGTWVAALQARGVDVLGIEGPWLKKDALECDPSLVQVRDLEGGFAFDRSFDLVVCLEVAEHIAPAAADRFIRSLVKHAPAVLFSAAIPGQGGHGHVNEQWLPYWVEQFGRCGFDLLDIFRGCLWEDRRVKWWLRQNAVLFARRELIAANEKLRSVVCNGPVSIVHPEFYQGHLREMQQYQQLEFYLRQGGKGGMFRTAVIDGEIKVQKVG